MITPTYSLEPLKRQLNQEDRLHLLRRSFFGVGQRDVEFFQDKSLKQCLDILLMSSPVASPLVQEDSDVIDPLVPKGQVWANAPYESDLINNRRGLMLKMDWVGAMLNRDHSLTEKMRLFWHTHFVTEMDVVKDSRYSYRYVFMLRDYALGNYKKLIREGTTNIAMLVYLNGNSNSKAAPNENYARELMELFTLGKGNANNYTEDDVRAGARVLSGWKDNKESLHVNFYPELHDTGDKQFSAFFEGHSIRGKSGENGAGELDELIDMIFKKTETARFLCRNLYRWFVCPEVDQMIEEKVIQPLSLHLIAHDFEVRPVLEMLLGSEHFFDKAFRGCIVKSPADFLLGAMQQFDVVATSKLDKNHESWLQYYFYLGDLSMDIGNPPSVAGWPAYYQAPKFHQWWINSATLSLRAKLLNGLSTDKGLNFNGTDIKFDFVWFVSRFENPGDVNSLISRCTELLCAVKISDVYKASLKAILLSGQQSEHYWTEAWDKYSKNSGDLAARSVVENRLRLFFKRIIEMPEFQML